MASERRARLEKLIIQYKAGDIDDKQLHGELQKLSKKSVPSNSINQLSSADNPVEQQNVEAVRVLMLEPEPSIHCFFYHCPSHLLFVFSTNQNTARDCGASSD